MQPGAMRRRVVVSKANSLSDGVAVMAERRIPHALISGLLLVVGVTIIVAKGLHLLTDGEIAKDPSLPTPATYAAVDRLMERDPVRGARAVAGWSSIVTAAVCAITAAVTGGILRPVCNSTMLSRWWQC